MLEEPQRRNFAPSTIPYYIRTVRDFAVTRPVSSADVIIPLCLA